MAELAFGIAEIVLFKLGSNVYAELGLTRSVKDDLRKLEETASNLKSVLKDAEKKQESNDADDLKRWLSRLKAVFNDAVDVLDEFDCEALRRQVASEHGGVGEKVRRFFSRSNPIAFRLGIADKVKEIRVRLDELAKEMAQFQLIRAQLNGREEQGNQGIREITHSFVNPSEVIGRESEKEEILEMLMSHKPENSDVSVIPIVGLGGLGKTTLAKSVFNDERVVDHFDLRLWICVALDFNVTESMREILKSAITAINSSDVENLAVDKVLKSANDIGNLSIDQLQMFLRSILKDKRVLIVMDDVWNEDRSKWNEVESLLLMVCAKGSRILVTTRSEAVASIMGTVRSHVLACLSEKDSLSLFLKYALGNEELAGKFPKLVDIGLQIVKKCKGVPLALKSLGSLLYSKNDETGWILIRDSKIWELKDDPILSALRLSYITMPPQLKQCFVYCSLIPKSIRVESTDMIWKWMALGALESTNDKMEMEDVGKLCFKELCVRSFFQYLDDGKENYNLCQSFEMHDLIHDLALSIIKHEHAIVNSETTTIHENTRYLTLFWNHEHGQRISRILLKCNKVQSVFLSFETGKEPTIDESFISTCISSFKRLRVFDMLNLSFEVLPSSIGNLKHLRYLSLSDNKRIKKLPDSICNLQCLQCLGLDGCDELEELPTDIAKLISLRVLFVTTKQIYFQENGIGRLKSLRVLCISMCMNLKSLPHDLRHCTTLRTLILAACQQLELASSEADEYVTPLSLQSFMIESLPRTTFLPHWIQGSANTLQQMVIGGCPVLASLPDWLSNLTTLREITIRNCPKLLSFPEGMQRLKSLTHLTIGQSKALGERCQRDVGEDWPKIAHVPNISMES